MSRTDEELMRALQSGDGTAMNQIFQNNKKRIFNFCYSLLGHRADAEDIAGDVFVSVLKNRDQYDSTRTFSTWIFTIARNMCFNRMRVRKHSVSMWFTQPGSHQSEEWDIESKEDDSRDALLKKERAQHVCQAIAKLPFEQKEALELRQYQGFSYAEISEILDCSLEKVKILIYRAKENLRSELAAFIKGDQS